MKAKTIHQLNTYTNTSKRIVKTLRTFLYTLTPTTAITGYVIVLQKPSGSFSLLLKWQQVGNRTNNSDSYPFPVVGPALLVHMRMACIANAVSLRLALGPSGRRTPLLRASEL